MKPERATPERVHATIDERLKIAMARRGCTVRGLAAEVGCNKNTLTNILNGGVQQPSALLVRDLAIELNVTTDWLLGLSNKSKPARRS
jgi:transcriptional regulator with XRE-family HTH domain